MKIIIIAVFLVIWLVFGILFECFYAACNSDYKFGLSSIMYTLLGLLALIIRRE